MLVALCGRIGWEQNGETLKSFSRITDEPSAEVVSAGHCRRAQTTPAGLSAPRIDDPLLLAVSVAVCLGELLVGRRYG